MNEVPMDGLPDTSQGGASFAVPDLIIAKGWADYHGLRFSIELDRKIDGIMHEEVLCFELPRFRRWELWRSGYAVIARPDSRVLIRFDSLPEALEGLGLEAMILSA